MANLLYFVYEFSKFKYFYYRYLDNYQSNLKSKKVTLLVAVKVPTKHLNPNRYPIRFTEKGIVLAQDSRFTYDGGGCVDNGRKIWPIEDFAVAGYSGDVEIAEHAIAATQHTIKHYNWKSRKKITIVLRNWLRFCQDKVGRKIHTVVFLGIRTEKGSFKLFEFNSGENYKPKERDGVISGGSGADSFNNAIKIEINDSSKIWGKRSKYGKLAKVEGKTTYFPPKPGDVADVNLTEVGNLIVSTTNLVIDKIKPGGVGGFTQQYFLTIEGLQTGMGYLNRKNGPKWEKITADPNTLKSNSTISKVTYDIPFMDQNCKIHPNQ